MNCTKFLSLITALACTLASAAVTKLNIDTPCNVPFKAKGQWAETMQQGGQTVLKAAWDTGQHGWGEYWWTSKGHIKIKDCDRVVVKVVCCAENDSIPATLNLRFVDAQDEVIAISPKEGKILKGQDSTLLYDIDLSKTYSGGWARTPNAPSPNGKFDMPISLQGFTQSAAKSGTSIVIIKEVTVETLKNGGNSTLAASVSTPSGPVSSFPFKLSTPANVSFKKDDQWAKNITVDEKPALQVGWDAAKHSWAECWWPWEKTTHLQNCKKVLVSATIIPDGEARPNSLSMRFVDKNQEVFQVPGKIPEGKGPFTITYELDTTKPFPKGGTWAIGANNTPNQKIDLPIALKGFSIGYPAKTGNGTITITNLVVSAIPDKEDADIVPVDISLALDTLHPVRMIDPADNGYCVATLENNSGSSIHFTVELTVKDIDGKPVLPSVKHIRTLHKNRHATYPLTVPKEPGYYTVEAAIRTELTGDKPVIRKRSFAVATLTHLKGDYKEGEFRFGVQLHLNDISVHDWMLDGKLIEQIGVRFYRIGFCASDIMNEKFETTYNYYDSRINFYKSLGLIPAITMNGGIKQFCHRDPHDPKSPHYYGYMPRLDVWEIYCRNIFQYYGKTAAFFELWNEPDLEWFALFSPEEYHELAKVAHRVRNEVDPKISLHSAGFCSFTSKNNFTPKALKLSGKLFDVIDYHGHGTYEAYRGYINTLQQEMEKNDLKQPWYAHETALTSTGNGEQLQAENVWKKIVFSWSRGSLGYTWYDHRNDGYDPKNPEHNYGLIHRDFYPKPAYVAYNALTGILNGPTTFLSVLPDKREADIYLFKRGGDMRIVLWSNRNGNVGNRTFKTNATEATYVDMYGKKQPLKLQNGLVSVPLSYKPAGVCLKHASTCELVEGYLDTQALFVMFDNNTAKQEITLHNQTKQSATIAFSFDCPKGIQPQTKPAPISLKPGEKRQLSLSFRATERELPIGTALLIKADSRELGPAELALPVNMVKQLTPQPSGTPICVLDSPAQTKECFEAQPGDIHRLRQGVKDQSAKIYMGADAKTLRIRIVAEDDIHSQPNETGFIWKGDCAECFLVFPGENVVWHFGCALGDDGKTRKILWEGGRKNSVEKDMVAHVERKGTQTIYNITLPWSAFGTASQKVARDGFLFNMLLDESDDKNIRESWMQMAPGIGDTQNTEKFPLFKIAK